MNVEYVKAKDRPWDIYAIINKKNNKIYIGQTTQPLKQRFAQHFSGKTYSAIKRSGDSLDLNDYDDAAKEVATQR